MWILITLALLCTHDFHVSRMVMDYTPGEQSLEVSLHVFTDDLEFALQNRGHDSLRLNTQREISTADQLIEQYLCDVINMQSQNGEQAELRYLGKEASEDYMASWIYFYLDLPVNEGEYTLRTSLLTEIYDDQQNIVNLRGTNEPVLKLLTADNQQIIFSIP